MVNLFQYQSELACSTICLPRIAWKRQGIDFTETHKKRQIYQAKNKIRESLSEQHQLYCNYWLLFPKHQDLFENEMTNSEKLSCKLSKTSELLRYAIILVFVYYIVLLCSEKTIHLKDNLTVSQLVTDNEPLYNCILTCIENSQYLCQ